MSRRTLLRWLPALGLALATVAAAQQGPVSDSPRFRMVVFHGEQGITTAVSPSDRRGGAAPGPGMLSLAAARGEVGGAPPAGPMRDLQCERLGTLLLVVGLLFGMLSRPAVRVPGKLRPH